VWLSTDGIFSVDNHGCIPLSRSVLPLNAAFWRKAVIAAYDALMNGHSN
jgi:hypothetical protein